MSILMTAGCTKKTAPESTSAPQSTIESQKTIVIIGDSLTEGYGVTKNQAFPHLVQQRFLEAKQPVKVVSAGISGSTSASGPERVTWALKSNPDIIVLALGANDGLRGLPTDQMKKNLEQSIDLAQKAGKDVLLFGMMMPPNFGKAYTESYAKVFTDLAQSKNIPLLPFLLKDVGGVASMNQSDGVHPNEKGHQILATTVYDFLKDHIL